MLRLNMTDNIFVDNLTPAEINSCIDNLVGNDALIHDYLQKMDFSRTTKAQRDRIEEYLKQIEALKERSLNLQISVNELTFSQVLNKLVRLQLEIQNKFVMIAREDN